MGKVQIAYWRTPLKYIPKKGIDISTADEFTKRTNVKINNEDIKQQSDTNKNITKLKHNNIPSCDLWGKSL